MAEAREGAEDALQPMDTARQQWLRQEKETMSAADRHPPLLLAKRAFAAGFAAALAHATTSAETSTTAAETERVTAMEKLLRMLSDGPLAIFGPKKHGIVQVKVAGIEWSEWQERARALLGPAATEGDR